MTRRAYLHSGGVSPAAVRAGTGGRKRSQWRTEIDPPRRKQTSGMLCAQCLDDKALIKQVESLLKGKNLPPLASTAPVVKGAPGSARRRQGLAARERLGQCKCQAKKGTQPNLPNAGPLTKPGLTKEQKQPRTASAAAARRRLSSGNPYDQVLAHDRLKELEQKRRR